MTNTDVNSPKKVYRILALGILAIAIIHTTLSLLDYAQVINYPNAFIGIGKFYIPYGDLAQLTFTASCPVPIQSLADGSQTCDPAGRPFNLMFPALLIFRALSINQNSHATSGLAVGAITIGILIYFATQLRAELPLTSQAFLSAGILTSYPFQLALERGNTDLVIFASLILFAISFDAFTAQKSAKQWLASAFISSFSILFKLWAGPGIILTLLFTSLREMHAQKSFRIARLSLALAVFLVALFVVSYLGSAHVFRNTEVWEGHVSFGVNASYYPPSVAEPGLYKDPIRAWKLLLCVAGAWWAYRWPIAENHISNRSGQCLSLLCLQLGFFTYASVYLLSTSWDYRLISLSLAVPYFLHQLALNRKLSLIPIGLIAFVAYELYIPVEWAWGIPETLSDFIAQPALIGILAVSVSRSSS